jgi:hypothetical protein
MDGMFGRFNSFDRTFAATWPLPDERSVAALSPHSVVGDEDDNDVDFVLLVGVDDALDEKIIKRLSVFLFIYSNGQACAVAQNNTTFLSAGEEGFFTQRSTKAFGRLGPIVATRTTAITTSANLTMILMIRRQSSTVSSAFNNTIIIFTIASRGDRRLRRQNRLPVQSLGRSEQ